MVGSLVRRERRPLWVALTIVFAAAAGASMWFGSQAREQAIRDADAQARVVAQTDLTPVLVPKDLTAPVTGERARQLGEDVDRTITSLGTFDRVRLFGQEGRILWADNAKFVGTRPAGSTRIVGQAAEGETRSRIVGDVFETYVPVWLTPGGTVGVAELTRPVAPISASATEGWNVATVIAGLIGIVCLAMSAVTGRARPAARPARPVPYQPAIPRRPLVEGTPSATPASQASVFATDDRAALEARLRAAEARAEAAEENFRTVQAQLKPALAQIKELEGGLAMEQTRHTTADSELGALRDQLRDTSERLHKLELDNNALRERIALRQQELDETRHQLQAMRGTTAEVAQLRAKLDTAENAAAALIRELERVENELDFTKSKLHMTKLSEALREFDNDDDEIEISEEDDLFEHPVIIRNGPTLPSGKVR